MALGTTQQVVAIDGSTVVSFPGQPTATNQGGILALSSNIGHYTHNSFSAIPQLSGRVGYRLTERLTFLVGYTAIYWGHVARAGDQIDTAVNPNLIPPPISGGPNRPSLHAAHFGPVAARHHAGRRSSTFKDSRPMPEAAASSSASARMLSESKRKTPCEPPGFARCFFIGVESPAELAFADRCSGEPVSPRP